MGKTHIIDQGGIRPGDVVKLVTNLSVEDQLAVNNLSKLGDQGILDQRAALLQSIANEAKEKAVQRRIVDQYPHLVPELPVVRPTYALAQIAMLSIILCAVVALAVQFGRSAHPSLSAEAQTPAPAALDSASAAPSRQKGRVGR